jgi:2-dehydropantoate 2-reductase
MARRYAIVGTGALGGLYGARLHHAGLEVHFLCRSDYPHLRECGLVVESKDGDFSIARPNVYGDVHNMPICDVVCVTLKTTANHQLPELLPPLVGPQSVVLVLQNGLGIEEDVARIVGPERVMGGICFLCSNKIGPGHIRHLDYGAITLAEFRADHEPAGVTERLTTIGADFQRAGIPVRAAEDLVLARWKKLLWNVPFNGLSVVLNSTTDVIMRDDAARSVACGLMTELAADARALGREIPDRFIQKMLDDTAAMVPYRTSMKIDYDAGREMEIEAIFGNPLRAAQAVGSSSPRLETLYRVLTFLDRHNRGLV